MFNLNNHCRKFIALLKKIFGIRRYTIIGPGPKKPYRFRSQHRILSTSSIHTGMDLLRRKKERNSAPRGEEDALLDTNSRYRLLYSPFVAPHSPYPIYPPHSGSLRNPTHSVAIRQMEELKNTPASLQSSITYAPSILNSVTRSKKPATNCSHIYCLLCDELNLQVHESSLCKACHSLWIEHEYQLFAKNNHLRVV